MKTTESTYRIALALALACVLAVTLKAQNIYVLNNGNGTVGEYTTSGATVNASLISGLPLPYDVAISGTNLFVLTPDTVGEYTTCGTTVNASLISGLTNGTICIAISGTNLFVVNNQAGTIGEYTTSGATVNASLISGLNYPAGIAISGTNVFVADGGVGEYTTSGATVNASLISSGAFAIAICGTNLFVASFSGPSGQGSVGEYTTSGATVNTSLISGLNDPAAIALAFGPPPPTPQLNVGAVGNRSVVFYPSWAAGYVLQSVTNLASTNWLTVTNGIPIVGVTVTNNSPALFFRLAPQQ